MRNTLYTVMEFMEGTQLLPIIFQNGYLNGKLILINANFRKPRKNINEIIVIGNLVYPLIRNLSSRYKA